MAYCFVLPKQFEIVQIFVLYSPDDSTYIYLHYSIEVVESMGLLCQHIHVLVRIPDRIKLVQYVLVLSRKLFLLQFLFFSAMWSARCPVLSPVPSFFPLLPCFQVLLIKHNNNPKMKST